MTPPDSTPHPAADSPPDAETAAVAAPVGPADNVVLIGFMGAGKSSIARELTRFTGRRCTDTDHLVVRTEGAPIPEIFARHGEKYFRDRETDTLHSLQSARRLVIATGGGIVLREENVPLLRALGCVVWLRADEDVLFERVQRTSKRPLLQTADPRATLAELLRQRDPLYAACAHLTVDTTHRSHAEVAEFVVAQATRFFGGDGAAEQDEQP